MQEFNLIIHTPNGEEVKESVAIGTPWRTLAEKYQQHYKDRIVLVQINHKLRELNKTVKTEGDVSFVTMTDKDGKRAYRRSITLLMQKAANNIWGKNGMIRVHHSLGHGVFCSLEDMEHNNHCGGFCSHANDDLTSYFRQNNDLPKLSGA
jgi:uridine kinase